MLDAEAIKYSSGAMYASILHMIFYDLKQAFDFTWLNTVLFSWCARPHFSYSQLQRYFKADSLNFINFHI